MTKRTYWLYEGSKCIGAIRADTDATDVEVRSLVVSREKDFPLGHHEYETPVVYRSRLSRATVRTFN